MLTLSFIGEPQIGIGHIGIMIGMLLRNFDDTYVQKQLTDAGRQRAYLFCGHHREWHPSDSFSGGSHGQRRMAQRYCIATPDEVKRAWPAGYNASATDDAKVAMAEILQVRFRDAPAQEAADPSARAVRAARLGVPLPEREREPRRNRQPSRPAARQTRAATAAATEASSGRRPPRSENARLRRIWNNPMHRQYSYWTNRRRGCASAVDLPPCTKQTDMLAELARLREAGTLRIAKKRKLTATHGLVEWITDELELAQPRSMVCGQAAIVHFTGMPLRELGLQAWPVCSHPRDNCMSFTCINKEVASGGAASAFLLRKPLAALTAASDVFAQPTGVFVIHVYHVPEDGADIGSALPYGHEVVGLR